MSLTVVERKTRLIGAIMVERGLLTSAQLTAALDVQAERGGLLGEIVVAEFGVSRAEVSQVIAEQLAELEAETGSGPSSTKPRSQLRVVQGIAPGGRRCPPGARARHPRADRCGTRGPTGNRRAAGRDPRRPGCDLAPRARRRTLGALVVVDEAQGPGGRRYAGRGRDAGPECERRARGTCGRGRRGRGRGSRRASPSATGP